MQQDPLVGLADRQHVAHFGAAQPFYVAQHDNLALPGGQAAEPEPQQLGQLNRVDAVLGLFYPVLWRHHPRAGRPEAGRVNDRPGVRDGHGPRLAHARAARPVDEDRE